MKKEIILIALVALTSCDLTGESNTQKKYQDYFYDINKLSKAKIQIFKSQKNDSIEYFFTKIERLIKENDTFYIQKNFNNYTKFDSLISKINKHRTEIVELYFFSPDPSKKAIKAELISGQIYPNKPFKSHKSVMNVATSKGDVMHFKGNLSLLKIEEFKTKHKSLECMVMSLKTSTHYMGNLLFSSIDTMYMAKGLGLVKRQCDSMGENKLWTLDKIIDYSDFNLKNYKDYSLPKT